jgi:predicted TPR repeat methyltransferase
VRSGICLDLACGTGTFAQVLSRSTDGSRIEALDVSSSALKSLAANSSHGITTIETDFWDFIPSSTYDLIVCVDAIHHLGYVEDVIGKITKLLGKNGVLVANLWTADNFDEFEIMRYGRPGHFYRMVRFAVFGILHAYLKKGGLSYRTHFVLANQIQPLLVRHFHDIKYLEHQRYFSTFVCQGPK